MPTYAEYKDKVAALEQENTALREKLAEQTREHDKTKNQVQREQFLRDVYYHLTPEDCTTNLLGSEYTRITENIIFNIRTHNGDKSAHDVAKETAAILDIVYDAATCAMRHAQQRANEQQANN